MSAVGISVPSIFCILKFLLIQVYQRSGTLISLLLWLYSFKTLFPSRYQPHSQSLLPFQNGGQTRRKTIRYCMISWLLNTSKIAARYNSKYSVFLHYFIALCTSIPRKYSIFIQQLNLFHFRKIFQFLRNPWDWEPCRETVRNDKKLWNSRQNREIAGLLRLRDKKQTKRKYFFISQFRCVFFFFLFPKSSGPN